MHGLAAVRLLLLRRLLLGRTGWRALGRRLMRGRSRGRLRANRRRGCVRLLLSRWGRRPARRHLLLLLRRLLSRRGCLPLLGRSRRRSVILAPGVITHRLIYQVIDGAIEVVGHLLEDVPEDVPAVKVAHGLLALIHLS